MPQNRSLHSVIVILSSPDMIPFVWLMYVGIVHSWDSDAHKMVAKMAAGLLSRKAARFVTYHTKTRDDKQFNRRMTVIQHALVSISSWADYVAATDPGMQWSAPLHFAHTPHQACDAFRLERDCPGGRCIVTAITEYMEIASDFEATKEARLEAIKFLVHLMADIHNPMHLGFEDDAGGNRINVFVGGTDEAPVSLHEVWDTVLIDRIKGESQWWETKLKITLTDRQSYSTLPLTDFAAQIASETAQHVTCQYGYQYDDGRWIERDDVLPIDYLNSRARTAATQLKKSAVRLAQLIEHISARYYEQETLSRGMATIADGSSIVVSNPFESLEGDDASFEDVVFELEDPLDVINEAEEDPHVESGDEPTRLLTESLMETSVGTAEPTNQRSRNQKKADAKKRNKLVLIKRDSRYFITQKKSVLSDIWKPDYSIGVSVSVPYGSILICLDRNLPDLAPLDQEKASRFLTQAVGKDCVPPPHIFAPPTPSDVDIYISSQGIQGGVIFGSGASLERSKKFAIPPEKDLILHYPEAVDFISRSQRYALDIFSANADKFVVWNLAGLLVVSRRDFLDSDLQALRKPRDLLRLHFNHFQVRLNSLIDQMVFIDTRVYDGPLAFALLQGFVRIGKLPSTQRNVNRIDKSSLSGLIPAIQGVHAFLKQRIPARAVKLHCPQLIGVNSITRTGSESIPGRSTIQLVFEI